MTDLVMTRPLEQERTSGFILYGKKFLGAAIVTEPIHGKTVCATTRCQHAEEMMSKQTESLHSSMLTEMHNTTGHSPQGQKEP